MGDRVCVDTCTLMTEGEGILVGDTSSVLFLVQAETLENPYVASRPFRINAGAVHGYTLTGTGTKYLAELCSGHEVRIVSPLKDPPQRPLSAAPRSKEGTFCLWKRREGLERPGSSCRMPRPCDL
jgi:hypothetical protein